MIGTLRKLQRFFDPKSRRTLVLALDHGPSEGLTSAHSQFPALLDAANRKNISGVVLNKGMARAYGGELSPDRLMVVQLSAGTKHGLPSYNKSVVCSISEALRLGADAVAVHVNIGNDLEDRMLQDLGMVVDEAHQVGLPVMAMVYPSGGQIVNELDSSLISHCIVLAGELGADLICVPYPGDKEAFGAAVSVSPVPVLVGGGPRVDNPDELMTMMDEALGAGAAGVTIGRNVFDAKDPVQTLDKIIKVVHGDSDKENTPA